jgi:hypothetical protein
VPPTPHAAKAFHISHSADIYVNLYKSLIGPRLEYAVQAWRPHLLRNEKDLIEQIQRKATKLVKGIGNNNNEDRLR